MPLRSLVPRLEEFLRLLDEKMQAEGLYPDEVEAKETAHLMVNLHRVYERLTGEELFYAATPEEGDVIRTLRTRIHLLEGNEAAIRKLLEFAHYAQSRLQKQETVYKAITEAWSSSDDAETHQVG